MNWLVALVAVLGASTIAPPVKALFGLLPLFNIHGPSMLPTLVGGDYLLTFSAGNGLGLRLGRVVVYDSPRAAGAVDIKRIVGVAGDRIQMVDGVLHRNGQAVPRERMDDFLSADSGAGAPVRSGAGANSFRTVPAIPPSTSEATGCRTTRRPPSCRPDTIS